MKISSKEIVKVFTEWDKQYRNNPEKFISEAEHLLKNTPDSYGAKAAIYFEKVLKEIK